VTDEAMPMPEEQEAVAEEVAEPQLAEVPEPEPVAEEPVAEEPVAEEPAPVAEPEPVAEEPAPPLDPPLPDLPIEEPEVPDVPDPAEDLAEHLLGVGVRFWAELGRAELPLAEAVALGTGAIVDLDREPSEPVDVYVNGTRFATARLLVVDGEWAIRLEDIIATPGAVEQLSSSGSGA
jgi:flagellar motor switch protein FliN